MTRIPIVRQTEWSMESFGRSVKLFPLIGGIIGSVLGGSVYLLQHYANVYVPNHVLAAALIIVEVFLTGGLHCDGFMDTADGVFSGRSKERMLEIMKDSRVGAFGAMAFALLMLLKYSLYLDISPALLPMACLVMPIVGRTGVVLAITLFPYARPEGMGKTFFQYRDQYALGIAGMMAFTLLGLLGMRSVVSGVAGLFMAAVFSRYVSKRLDGLTGDVYGAVNEVTQIAALAVFLGW